MNEEKLKKEIENLKEDLRIANGYFINCSNKLLAAEKEVDELKQRLKDIKEGFEGCCYACESVGMLNRELEDQLKAIEEDGTEEHNNAIDLRIKLAESRLETHDWKKMARKLYGVALHLQEVSNKSVVIVGQGLYDETRAAVLEYEKLQNE